MEERVVVLRGVAFVVAWVLGRRIVLVFAVRIIESGGGEGARFNSGAEGSLAHVTARFRLLGNETVLVVVGANLGIPVAVGVALSAEREAVSCGTCSCVCDCDEGDDGTNDDGGFTCTASTNEWIALVVVRFHAHSGKGEVRAVDCDDGGLSQTSAGVDVLNGRVDGDDRRYEEKNQVDLPKLVYVFFVVSRNIR